MSESKFLKKAINPKHKGFCTPMTKKTCTPARKALAKRFKSGDLHNESAQRLVAQLLEEEIPGDHLHNPPSDSGYDTQQIHRKIRDLMAGGMSYEQAREQALQAPPAMQAISSSVSGGLRNESAPRLVAQLLEKNQRSTIRASRRPSNSFLRAVVEDEKGENSEMIDQTDTGDSATEKGSEMMDNSPIAPKAGAKKSKDGAGTGTDSSGADSSSDVRSPTSTDVRSPTKTSTSTDAYTARNITITGGAGDGDTIVNVHADHEDEKDVPKSGGAHGEKA